MNMTNEEKQLLLQDISARLPYKVCARQHYSAFEDDFVIEGIIGEQIYAAYNLKVSMAYPVEFVNPYLRPMESMTKDEEETECYLRTYQARRYADFCNSKHLDYRRLIEKGLALPAPQGMYNF